MKTSFEQRQRSQMANRINEFTVISFLHSYFLIVLTFFNAELMQS